MECLNCGKTVERRFIDVQEPPLSTGECLCAKCCLARVDEAIDRAFDQILRLKMFRQEVQRTAVGEPPYIQKTEIVTLDEYNPKYGDHRLCECGHPYYRHFDTHENMEACGCKYCPCNEFKEKSDE